MAVDLVTPIPSTRTRSINFFNGRLLAGEDLTTEQQNNRFAHSLLAQAIGDGVVYGFEVTESKQASTPTLPVLTVTQGLALNKNGAALLLDSNTDVGLVRPATTTNGTNTNIFQDCTPVQSGTYIAGAGVYLLTVGPATSPQGLAEVSGLSTTQASCNTKYNVQGVQFRLIPLNLTEAQLSDTKHLRNFVAYQCFGITDQTAFIADPFGTQLTSYGLLDQLRSSNILTNCDVPLAVLYWTSDLGIVFVDMWAVRRPVFPQTATEMWAPFASRRRIAEGLAMFLQFQSHIADLLENLSSSVVGSFKALDYFRYLPSIGILPISGIGSSSGVNYLTFWNGNIFRKPEFMEGARVSDLLREALLYPPVDLTDEVMVWLYWIRENMQTINIGSSTAPNAYIVFASGHVPNYGYPHYDVNRWDYSTYA